MKDLFPAVNGYGYLHIFQQRIYVSKLHTDMEYKIVRWLCLTKDNNMTCAPTVY